MFSLRIQQDNAAFEGDPGREVARILREVAVKLEEGTLGVRGVLRDANGNRVGTVIHTRGGDGW